MSRSLNFYYQEAGLYMGKARDAFSQRLANSVFNSLLILYRFCLELVEKFHKFTWSNFCLNNVAVGLAFYSFSGFLILL